jgi:ELWxxDGT repeat protein
LTLFRFAVALSLTCLALAANASDAPYLVRDFPGPLEAVGSLDHASLWTTIGNTSWFTADRADSYGLQVWKTDGTPDGTVAATHVLAQRGGHAERGFAGVVNGRLIYGGDGWEGGDVFESGRLFALDESGGEPEPIAPVDFYTTDFLPGVLYKGALYFGASFTKSNGTGPELWRTDGTAAGTAGIDLNPGRGTYSIGFGGMAVLGDWMLFAGETSVGQGVFRTDGTVAGTTRLVPFPVNDSLISLALTPLGDRIVFAVEGASPFTDQLWITDGTPDGTRLVADAFDSYRLLAVLDGRLLFEMSKTGALDTMWTTDGTAAGTQRLNDTSRGIFAYSIYAGGIAGGKFFYYTSDLDTPSVLDEALFTTGALPGTTTKVIGGLAIEGGVGLGDKFYFAVHDEVEGGQWWVSDGTPAGTRKVGPLYWYPEGNLVFQRALRRPEGFLVNARGASGREPWLIDGVGPGWRLLKNIGIDTPAPGSDPRALHAVGDRLFFLVKDGFWGAVGRSNGTTAGTTIDPLFTPGDVPSIGPALSSGNHYYVMSSRSSGQWLLSTDGTDSGSTVLSVKAHGVIAFRDGVLFTEDGTRIIRFSDGTPSVLRVIEPIDERYASFDWEKYSANGQAWFVFSSTLAVSDGTARMRRVLPSSGPFARITEVVDGPDATYIVDEWSEGSHFYRLWRSDGTNDGTRIVRTFPVPPQYFTATPHKLFFTQAGVLWSTDGTDANTVALPATGYGCGDGGGTATDGDRIFWNARQTDGSYILWKSDGTPGGTVNLATFPAAPFTGCRGVAVLEGRASFSGFDPAHGVEPWVSDGTVEGTHLLADLFTGPQSSEPQEFTIAAGHLFFSADSAGIGRELWAIGDRGLIRRRAASH